MKTVSIVLLFIAFWAPGFAANPDNGKELHNEKCTRCHDSAIYTRSNRRVHSLPKLGTQVRFCKDNLGITWFDDEVDDVVLHLNQEFYKFK